MENKNIKEIKESHNYDHSHEHAHIPTNSILLTFLLNSFFTILEFFVGILSNSVTISSNAIHDLGDSIILFFSLILERKSRKGRNNKNTYGYRRFAILGNLINSFILLIGGIYIIDNAINRLMNPEVVNGMMMFYFAILGFIINAIGAYKLFKENNTNNKALFINILSDCISWALIIVSSIAVMQFHIYILDTFFSLFIGLWLIYNGVVEINKMFKILIQSVPDDIDIEQIEKIIVEEEKVLDVHDIHIWTLDGYDYIATFHIVIDSEEVEHLMAIKETIKMKLENYSINHTTIEVDTVKQASINGEFNKGEK